MFFTFRQNNSGGQWSYPAINVIVEAEDGPGANSLAERKMDVYFDGCSKGWDCSCCGDRWYPMWTEEEGDDEPSLYGQPVSEMVENGEFVLTGTIVRSLSELEKIYQIIILYENGDIVYYDVPPKESAE